MDEQMKADELQHTEFLWRHHSIELAQRLLCYTVPLYKSTGSVAILPPNVNATMLIPSGVETPCPLCPASKVAPTKGRLIRRHMKRFHEAHSFTIEGNKFLLCRLSCMSHSHYHCSCGSKFTKKMAAKLHVHRCLKQAQKVGGEAEVRAEMRVKLGNRGQLGNESAVIQDERVKQAANGEVGIEPVNRGDVRIKSAVGGEMGVQSTGTAEVRVKHAASREVRAEPALKTEVGVKTAISGEVGVEPAVSAEVGLEPAVSAEVGVEHDNSGGVGVMPKRKHPSTLCLICHKRISKKNIRRHFRLHRPKESAEVTCVDQKKGIYLVESQSRGGAHPIHVKVKTFGKTEFECSNKECQIVVGPAARGHQSYVCAHVLSAINAPGFSIEKCINNIDTLPMSAKMKLALNGLKAKAVHENSPLVVEYSDSTTYQYFSVFCGSGHHWAHFGRTVVWYKNQTLSCPCSGMRHSCVHKAAVKCAMGLSAEEVEEVETCPPPEHVLHDMQQTTVTENDVLAFDSSVEFAKLEPSDKVCPSCGAMLESVLATSNGKIVDYSFVREGVCIYLKECKSCERSFSYIGISDGLLNHNNSVVLTLRFCRWLRSSIENHIAISTEVSRLADFYKIKYPPAADILRGYLKFEVMCDHDYDFCCIECGEYPPIMITDVNKKCCFRLKEDAVSIQQPKSETVSKAEFWNAVDQNILYPKQSMKILPSYHFWASYVGKAGCDNVVNTEYSKLPGSQEKSKDKDELPDFVNEDFLLELMHEKQVHEIRSVCRLLEISDKGNKMDCILRLRDKMLDGAVCKKIFTKLVGSSGGVLCACCPHGIVYGVKYLLRAESPRDHVDLLMSFKEFPTLTICDIPAFVAKHGNKRQSDMFWPNEGRFAELSPENIDNAAGGHLKVSIPELDLNKLLFSQSSKEHSYSKALHPLTGTNHHFCGYDRFHEDNTVVPAERLRRLDIVPECSSVNSQVVEELFSVIGKSCFFLTQMDPVHHIFLVRLLLHLNNMKRNSQRMNIIQKKVLPGCHVTTGSDSRVMIVADGSSTDNQEFCTIKSNGNVPAKLPERVTKDENADPMADRLTNIEDGHCGTNGLARENVGDGALNLEPGGVTGIEHNETYASIKGNSNNVPPPLGILKRTRKETATTKSKKVCFESRSSAVIWDLVGAATGDIVLARHGPYALTVTDFKSLRGATWLTDQVMDAYLHMLTNQTPDMTKVLHLPMQTMTSILNGNSAPVLQKVNFKDFDSIVGVYLQGSVHWTSLVICMGSGIIRYYDSYGEKSVMCEKIQKNWRNFIASREAIGLDSGGSIFRVVPQQSAIKQKDAHHCGVYALKFAHDQLRSDTLPMRTPNEGRHFIASSLYIHSELKDVYCIRCGHDEGILVACTVCGSKFHRKCTDERRRYSTICFKCPF